MSMNPLSVSLPMLSAFINQTDKPYLGGMLGPPVVDPKKWQLKTKNLRDVRAAEEAVIRVTPSVLFSLLPVSISTAASLLSVDFSPPLTFFSLSSPPFPCLMKGFICHPAGDECNVFHPDLYLRH